MSGIISLHCLAHLMRFQNCIHDEITILNVQLSIKCNKSSGLFSRQRARMSRFVTAAAVEGRYENSWKCICVVGASLAFGLYGR